MSTLVSASRRRADLRAGTPASSAARVSRDERLDRRVRSMTAALECPRRYPGAARMPTAARFSTRKRPRVDAWRRPSSAWPGPVVMPTRPRSVRGLPRRQSHDRAFSAPSRRSKCCSRPSTTAAKSTAPPLSGLCYDRLIPDQLHSPPPSVECACTTGRMQTGRPPRYRRTWFSPSRPRGVVSRLITKWAGWLRRRDRLRVVKNTASRLTTGYWPSVAARSHAERGVGCCQPGKLVSSVWPMRPRSRLQG